MFQTAHIGERVGYKMCHNWEKIVLRTLAYDSGNRPFIKWF